VNLIKWELTKIFKQRSIYVIAILLFGLFTFSTFANTFETKYTQKAYKKWEGPLTQEKLTKAETLKVELNENVSKETGPEESKSALSGVVENIMYVKNIENTILERDKELEKLIGEAKSKDDVSLANMLHLQKQMFNEIKIDQISYYRGPQETVDFVNVYGLVLTGVFLLIGLAGIYSNEHSSGVENYILSTKNGRTKTMMAKLAASFIFATVTVLLWEAFNLITHTIIYGTKGWDLPLQYSFKYFSSPYNFTFMEYHLIQIAFHLLGAIAFAGVIVLISTLSKSTVISFFVSGFLFGIPILVDSIMNMKQEWIKDILRYTLTNIMKVEELFTNFISVNVLGYPVLAPFIGLAFTVSILVLTVFLAKYIIIKKQIA
jgi:ABC-type transport system involved in multi-copper enzyme maturation permease subunit